MTPREWRSLDFLPVSQWVRMWCWRIWGSFQRRNRGQQQSAIPAIGFKSGETLIYNQWGMFVKLTENGIEVEAKGKPVTVANATTVTVTATEKIRLETPRLEVTGDVIDNCDSNGATLKALRDAHNDHDHIVKNVQSGNDEKTSEKPGRSSNE